MPVYDETATVQLVTAIVAVLVMIYGFLLIVGAPFGKSKQWANKYAKGLMKTTYRILKWTVLLPFRIAWAIIRWPFKKLFGSTKKKKKKKK